LAHGVELLLGVLELGSQLIDPGRDPLEVGVADRAQYRGAQDAQAQALFGAAAF